MNNKKEVKLINKVKRLLRRLRCPRYLHHFGPKTYEFYEHVTALLVGYNCRLSYRRTIYFMDLIGIRCPSKSALQYTANKISSALWNKLLELTSGIKHHIIALDSTGFSRTNPSYHYLRRIDGKLPKIPVKLSAAQDTRNKKFCAGRIKVLPSHDIKDAKYLLDKLQANKLVADKAYDANWLHIYCCKRNIEAHIPLKDNGKVRHGNMSKRMLSVKHFRKRTYNRRSLEESGFGSLKRRFGGSVNSKKSSTIKSEVYGKMLCHNIFLGSIDF